MNSTITSFYDYLHKEKKYSQLTCNAYFKDVVDFQAYYRLTFDSENFEKTSYGEIRSWIIALVDSGLSNASVNRKLASLKAFYVFLLKCKQIDVSPLLKHKSLKTAKKIQIPFSEKELAAVLSVVIGADEFEIVRNKLILDLLYTTGIRRAELIGLKDMDVDCSSNVIKVLGKRNKERLIPVLPVIITQIKKYQALRRDLGEQKDKLYFFLSKKGIKLSESFVYRLINSYFSTASEKVKTSPHVLRHTFATHLLNNGADLNSVKELLGHASLASTQIYTHSSLLQLKKVYKEAHPRNK
ncbi:tyrosine-type recombinase/integrase [Flavobacterium sp. 14A]|uniref:tyrosine-type recombinase/integrase n=1 Tax=Flavobacterium sp. 14A TaxID=2735896 RepID=UPI00156E5C5F|nr:tyrosine-type recombinase/integrase [Flavobacterium sp. 14A]NRT11398.1 integrase/recombinase XerC [Flavobacterium sp. 14A]